MISFSPNVKIASGTEYTIDSILIKHSSRPLHHDNFLSASEIVYYEDKKKEFAIIIPSNFIAKELYHKLNENSTFVVWHKGAELTLAGKFHIKRKDGNEIIFKPLTHSIPFDYNLN